MKAILSTALLTVLTASAAHAEGLKVETRAFHANMQLDAEKSTYKEDGTPATVDGVSSAYFNTAGFGLSAVQTVDDVLDFGLGLSVARYYPTKTSQIDQTVLHGFSRINLVKTDASRVYMLAGLSRQQLVQDIESDAYANYKTRYTPIVNGDLGLGATFTVGNADLGLEYKYSNTLAAGRASLQGLYKNPGLRGVQISSDKNKLKGVTLQGQELALSVAVKL
ncbi:MAG TPA: hypothetical protein VE954_35380 [Oligoflexus sp.]|uniref:hypothetical protein n=1 Tax=Oligoflexus sp. TaxID=1971216 RepID=UPI002D3DAB91|nr:hypothetical protein [Oligoflexus sp.]HYX38415.1 hypothetical protein [Oligoflexus sp.]